MGPATHHFSAGNHTLSHQLTLRAAPLGARCGFELDLEGNKVVGQRFGLNLIFESDVGNFGRTGVYGGVAVGQMSSPDPLTFMRPTNI